MKKNSISIEKKVQDEINSITLKKSSLIHLEKKNLQSLFEKIFIQIDIHFDQWTTPFQ